VLRLAPAAYDWIMRRRIFRGYRELKLIEHNLDRAASHDDIAAVALQLDRLEDRINRVWVPTAFANMHYTLIVHVGLVRSRLERLQPR
jgi:hypothetical protein